MNAYRADDQLDMLRSFLVTANSPQASARWLNRGYALMTAPERLEAAALLVDQVKARLLAQARENFELKQLIHQLRGENDNN